jgi:hypothetical protein
VIVACLNDFCRKIKKKTIVVMDNSSIHRSEEFEDYIAHIGTDLRNPGLALTI